MKRKSSVSETSLVFEELEPRLLLSADALAVVTDAGVTTVQQLVLTNPGHGDDLQQASIQQAPSEIKQARAELLIIDSRAPNYQQLYNDAIKAQHEGRNIHVVVLDAHRDGVTQISEALERFNNLDAVHIVSHGSDGQLKLGASQLNNQSLKNRSDEIAQWKQAFSQNGDLLIYGCNLASTENGASLVEAIANITETEVAASDDLTGNVLKGGDWDLEYKTGAIETNVAFSEDIMQNWQGTLEGAAPAGGDTQAVIAETEKQAQLEQQKQAEQQALQLEQQQAAAKIEQEQQQAALVEEQRHEIVFIDESVSDYQAFIDDLESNSDASTVFEIVLLNGQSDGIEQINVALSDNSDIDAVHIFSHGNDGAVKIGNTWLNTDNIAEYSNSLGAWSNSFDANADILIYGCNLAETKIGEQFVNQLALLTGADVAASDDLTGHASLGGDWDLEYNDGDIETSISVSAALQQNWANALAPPVANNDSASTDEATIITVAAPGLLANDTDVDAAPAVTAGSSLNFNAANDGDGVWNDDNATAGFDWTITNFGTESTYTASPMTSYAGITGAYQFSGTNSGATMPAIESMPSIPAGSPASFEIWFRTDSLTGQHIIFETGGATHGTSIYLDGSFVKFATRTDGAAPDEVAVDLSALYVDPTAEFIQLVAVIDQPGGQILLYLDGTLQGTAALTGTNGTRWASPDATGLGREITDIATGPAAGSGSLDGDIAIFRFYESALVNTSVATNYAAVTGDVLSITEVEGNVANVGNQITLTSGALLTVNSNGSYSYDPNGQFENLASGDSTTDSFVYTVSDGTNTDSAMVTITINGVNDAPEARDDRIGLLFDGTDDYVRIGDYPNLSVSTSVSMEAWIRPTLQGAGTQIIINKEGEYELAINGATGEVMWAFANTDPGWAWHSTGYQVDANEWTHLAVTYNNGVVETYADGVLVETYNGSGAIGDQYPALNQLHIGGRENAVTQRFNGYIDEVRIWDTTLSQIEIQSNMNVQLTGGEAGLIGNWRFDEGSGSAVIDQTPYGHDGTLADGATGAEMPVWGGYVVTEDASLSVSAANGVLANDYDVDGDAITAVLDSGPTNAAAFTLYADGSFDYTPVADFSGMDSFSYHANDGSADSSISTVTIRVDAVNDAPVAIALSNNTVDENIDTTGGYSVGTLSSTDVDTGDSFIYSIIGGVDATVFNIGGASFDELILDDGKLNYETQNSYQVMVRTTDSSGATYDELLTITVNDVVGTISGVAYVDEGATNIGAGKTINMLVNGSLVESVVTGVGGDYSFTQEASAGDAVALFIDGDATSQGVTITVSDGSDLSGLQLFADHIIVRNDNGGVTSNADLAIALGAYSDPDIHYAVIGGHLIANGLNEEVLVPVGHSFAPGGNVSVSNIKVLGTMIGGANTFTIAENWLSSPGSWIAGGSTVNLIGTGTLNSGGNAFYNLQAGAASQVTTLTDNLTVRNVLTIADATGTLTDNGGGYDITVTGTGTPFVNNGAAVTAKNFIYRYPTDATIIASGGVYNVAENLWIAGSGTGSGTTYQLNGDLVVSGGLHLYATSFGVSILDTMGHSIVAESLQVSNSAFQVGFLYANNSIIDINGDVNFVYSVTTVVNLGSSDWSVSGDWTNFSNTFVAGSSTINLDGGNQQISGSTSFYNLTKIETINDGIDSALVFDNAATQTINGTLTLTGLDVNDRINLVSDVPGNQWNINLTATAAHALNYIVITDSDASGSDPAQLTINPSNSFSGGNNIGWFSSVVVDDGYTVDEGSTTNFNIAANDSDPDDGLDLTSIVITSGPYNGSVIVNANGTVDYTHNSSETISDSFTYTINDNSGNVSNTGTVAINVNPVNDAPVAVDDSYTTNEDGGGFLPPSGVLINDTDNEGSSLTAILVTPPANGSFTLNSNGSYWWWPDPDFNGASTFTYKVNDGSSDSNIATVTLNVTAINDAPVLNAGALAAINEDVTTPTGEDIATIFTGQFSDVDSGSSFSGIAVTGNTANPVTEGVWQYSTNSGTNWFDIDIVADDASALALDTATLIRFVPVANFNGAPAGLVVRGLDDTYIGGFSSTSGSETRANVNTTNNGGQYAIAGTTAVLSTSITPVNDAPLANNDIANVNEGQSVSIDLALNDSDVDNALDLNSIVIVGAPLHGTLTVNSDGTVDYLHNSSETLSDSFTYTISDISGGISNTATVNISINPVNDAPIAQDDAPAVDEAGAILINLVANDTDSDSAIDLNSVVITTAPVNGALLINSDGTVLYTHDGSETTGDSFSYTIADVNGAISNTANVNITVNPVNDAPVTSGIADITVDEDSATSTINLNNSFSDADNAPNEILYSIVGNTNIGLFNIASIDNASGTLSLDYATDGNGSTQITIRAQDPSGAAVDTLFNVTVTPVNDQPVIVNNNVALVSTTGAASVSAGELMSSDVDDASVQIIYTVTEAPVNGMLLLNGIVLQVNDEFTQDDIDNNRLSYQVINNTTRDEFRFTIRDSSGIESAVQTFSMLVQLGTDASDTAVTKDTDPGPGAVPGEEVKQNSDENAEVLPDPVEGFTPIGSSSITSIKPSVPPQLSIDPLPVESRPDVENLNIEPVNNEPVVAEQHTISTFVGVQLRSMDALWAAIDKMKSEISNQDQGAFSALEIRHTVIATSSISLTAGIVAWALRSGALVASMMSSIPLWKGYDPLPIIAYRDEESEDKKTDEAMPKTREEFYKQKNMNKPEGKYEQGGIIIRYERQTKRMNNKMSISPAVRLSFGLVMFTLSVLLIADLFGVVPKKELMLLDARKKVCESLAVQISMYASKSDTDSMGQVLQNFVRRNDDVVAASMTHKSGAILANAGQFSDEFAHQALLRSTSDFVIVPVYSGENKWGSVNVEFGGAFANGGLPGLLQNSLVGLLIFTAVFELSWLFI